MTAVDDVDQAASGAVLEALRAHYGAHRKADILDLADRAWAARPSGARPDDDLAELGECWRIAMLAATPERPGARWVWRTRAMEAFGRSDCHNGLAMLCLPGFFENVRDPDATLTESIEVLDTMLRLARDEPGPILRATVVSAAHEKRGYLYYELGHAEDQPDHFRTAIQSYAEALPFTEAAPDRRRFKIQAAALSARYRLTDPGSAACDEVIDELAALVEEVGSHGDLAKDVEAAGATNLDRMRAGQTDLVPYEIT